MDFIELREAQLDARRRLEEERRAMGALVWPPILCAGSYVAILGYVFALVNWQVETLAASWAVLFAAGGLAAARRVLR